MQIFIGYVLGHVIISKLCSKLDRSSASWITKDAALDGIINANGTIKVLEVLSMRLIFEDINNEKRTMLKEEGCVPINVYKLVL